MTGLWNLIKRNCKLFFKDKGMFFSSLITPVILLVLYATFLASVYRDSFASAMPEGFSIDASLINATVAAQLISSLLAVSCVTVAFCSNLLIVQDKITGARRDITVSPVKRSTLAVSYFCASAATTLIISFAALAVCLKPIANPRDDIILDLFRIELHLFSLHFLSFEKYEGIALGNRLYILRVFRARQI